MYSVKVTMGSRLVTVQAVGQCAKDRKEWRALVHVWMIEFHVAIIAWFLCSFDPPSRVLVTFHLERGGMQLHGAVGVKCTKGNYTDTKEQVPSI